MESVTSIRAKYAKETWWAFASKGTAFVFFYALVYYLTKQMGVSRWGEWTAFIALLNIITLTSDLGINIAVKRHIAETRNSAALAGVIKSSFVLRATISFGYVLIVAALIGPALGKVGRMEYAQLLYQSIPLILFYSLVEYFKTLFEAVHQLKNGFFLNLIEHGLKFFLAIAFFQQGDSYSNLILAFTVPVLIATLCGCAVSIRTYPGVLSSPVEAKLLREIFLQSIPAFVLSITGYLALEMDTLMLSALTNNYETGVYSAAKQIVFFLPHISLAVSMGVIPELCMFTKSNAKEQRRLYYKILAFIAGGYLVICLGIVGFAFFGVPVFFGEEYRESSKPLLLLAPYVFLNSILIYTGYMMDYKGLTMKRAINFLFTFVINIALNLLWIPKWGAVGAAAASSIAFLPSCILNLREAHRVFEMED